METNKVKITVSGLSRSGKSTIATIIANALRKENLDYSRIIEFENDLEDIQQKVGALKEKNTRIEIIEKSHINEPSWIKRNLSE